jgi:hypothetical protein
VKEPSPNERGNMEVADRVQDLEKVFLADPA